VTKLEKWFYRGVTVFCAGYLVYSLFFGLGDIKNPGPGFVPVFYGLLGLIFSVILTVNTFKQPTKNNEKIIDKQKEERLILYVLITLAFLPMFKYLGTILSLFILLICLIKIFGTKGWVKPIFLSLICSLAFYLIFAVVLKVPLPRGLITFI